MEIVFACSTAQVPMASGAVVPVQIGSHWPASDPVVRAHPSLFSTDPRFGMLFTEQPEGYDPDVFPPGEVRVEAATAAPGERRSVRRP